MGTIVLADNVQRVCSAGTCSRPNMSKRGRCVISAQFGELGDKNLVLPLKTDGKEPPTFVSAPGRRIVAVGDLHGDLKQTKRALRLAGVLDSNDQDDNWVGGTTVLVQVGDILDRGGDEIAIISLLQHLSEQAHSKGGAVFQVNGNHETMNVGQEFYDVSPSGFEDSECFSDYVETKHNGDFQTALRQWRSESLNFKAAYLGSSTGFNWLPLWNILQTRKRIAARAMLFSPGGPLALHLARHGVVLNVNGWLFAHGGVLPYHVKVGLEQINLQVSSWMRGERDERPFVATKGYDSIVWSRLYSRRGPNGDDDQIKACAVLQAALSAANAKGLVVGHTPQTSGANSECQGRVWRIDVGMSRGVLNADPEVLEIFEDEARVLQKRPTEYQMYMG